MGYTKEEKKVVASVKLSVTAQTERKLPLMSIIRDEMRYRKRVVEYAIKHNNNASAVRRYHTIRMQVKR